MSMCRWTTGKSQKWPGPLTVPPFQPQPCPKVRRVALPDHSNRWQAVVASTYSEPLSHLRKLGSNPSEPLFRPEKKFINHYLATLPIWFRFPKCHGAQTRAPSPKRQSESAASRGQSESQTQSAAKVCRGTEWEVFLRQPSGGWGNPSFFSSKFTIPQVFFFGTCHGQGLGLMLPFQGILNITLWISCWRLYNFTSYDLPNIWVRCLCTFTTCHLPNSELGLPAILVILWILWTCFWG